MAYSVGSRVMKTYKITNQKDLDKFKDEYGYKIDGNAEFSYTAIFEGRLSVEGYLSIKAGDWIEAGGSIKAGGSIEAGGWIEAGEWIKAGYSITAGGSITASNSITAGDSITAGGSIKVLRGGITAGLNISCNGLLKFKLRLFAGTSPYSWNEDCSKEVKCGKLEGNVVYGDIIETGLPDEPEITNPPEITFDGATYVLKEQSND